MISSKPHPDTQKNRTLEGVVRHEMGHFVVATAVGFHVLGLRVKKEQPRYGDPVFHGSAETSIVEPIEGIEQLWSYLKRRIQVLLAGSIAQAFDGEHVDPARLASIQDDNASDDFSKVRELFAVYLNLRRGQGFDDEFCSSETWPKHPFWKECEQGAIDTLRLRWPDINRVLANAAKQFQQVWNYQRTAEQLESIILGGES